MSPKLPVVTGKDIARAAMRLGFDVTALLVEQEEGFFLGAGNAISVNVQNTDARHGFSFRGVRVIASVRTDPRTQI